MPVGQPENCPECAREIVAPLLHAVCPDCGFQYDEYTLVWRPSRPWRIYLLFANVAVCTPFVFQFLRSLLLHGRLPSNATTVGAAIGLVALLWAVPRVRVLLTEGHRFAAITPRGIQVRTTRGPRLVEWDRLRAVRVRLGVPLLVAEDWPRPYALDWVFDTDAEVAEFLRQVRAGLYRYRPQAVTYVEIAGPAGP